VLPGRYLRDAARSCDARMDCPSKSVAAELGLHEHTVGKWRRRFLKDRFDGLLTRPALATLEPSTTIRLLP